jgi:hypothetical protein
MFIFINCSDIYLKMKVNYCALHSKIKWNIAAMAVIFIGTSFWLLLPDIREALQFLGPLSIIRTVLYISENTVISIQWIFRVDGA